MPTRFSNINREIQSKSPAQTILTESELDTAPLQSCHRDLAKLHLRRLNRIINNDNSYHSTGSHASKQVARRQSAQVTLVVRDHITSYQPSQGIDENTAESMIEDVIDASFYTSANQTVAFNPFSRGVIGHMLDSRELEIVTLMQTIGTQTADEEEVKPRRMHSAKEANRYSLHEDINWSQVMRRSCSEDNVLHRTRAARYNLPEEIAALHASKWWENVVVNGQLDLEAAGLEVSPFVIPSRKATPARSRSTSFITRPVTKCW